MDHELEERIQALEAWAIDFHEMTRQLNSNVSEQLGAMLKILVKLDQNCHRHE